MCSDYFIVSLVYFSLRVFSLHNCFSEAFANQDGPLQVFDFFSTSTFSLFMLYLFKLYQLPRLIAYFSALWNVFIYFC